MRYPRLRRFSANRKRRNGQIGSNRPLLASRLAERLAPAITDHDLPPIGDKLPQAGGMGLIRRPRASNCRDH